MKKSFALLLAVAVMLSAAMFSACDSSTFYIDVTSEISGETYRINRMEQKKAYFAGGMGIHFYTKLSPVEVARKLEGQAEKVEAYGNKLLLTYDLGGGKKDFLVVNSIAKTTDSGNEYFVRSAVAAKSSQKNDHSCRIYYLFPLHFLADETIVGYADADTSYAFTATAEDVKAFYEASGFYDVTETESGLKVVLKSGLKVLSGEYGEAAKTPFEIVFTEDSETTQIKLVTGEQKE